MTTDALCEDTLETAIAAPAADTDTDVVGWQALAEAELGRALTDAELATAERLPTGQALDLLFPTLADEARHEALWALGGA